ncbi:MAG: hypothetical protein H8F28_26290 [Fibrella sp.]|nr:hypothetical protein [Armatimonadota bacterium]
MSHRQKNKHKSRHRIHANNGPSVPQIARVAPVPAKYVAADATIAPTAVAGDATPSPAAI